MFNVIDPYFEEPEAEEVAVSNYDSKDFYEGSLIGLNGKIMTIVIKKKDAMIITIDTVISRSISMLCIV